MKFTKKQAQEDLNSQIEYIESNTNIIIKDGMNKTWNKKEKSLITNLLLTTKYSENNPLEIEVVTTANTDLSTIICYHNFEYDDIECDFERDEVMSVMVYHQSQIIIELEKTKMKETTHPDKVLAIINNLDRKIKRMKNFRINIERISSEWSEAEKAIKSKVRITIGHIKRSIFITVISKEDEHFFTAYDETFEFEIENLFYTMIFYQENIISGLQGVKI